MTMSKHGETRSHHLYREQTSCGQYEETRVERFCVKHGWQLCRPLDVLLWPTLHDSCNE